MRTLSQSPRDPAFVQDPYPFYDRARALGPLFLWEDYGFPCAAGHAEVGALLRDRRFGRELPAGLKPARPAHLADFYALDDRSMLDREPPAHTRLRGLVLRAFTSRRIAGLGPDIARSAERADRRACTPEFDLIAAFAEPLPVRVIARLLGVPEAMARQLLAWSHAMVAMYQARRDRAVEDAANAAARDFAAFLRDHVAARRGRPGRRSDHRAHRRRDRRRPARHRGADRHLRPPPQRRPRGHRPRHRQRRRRDPRRRPRPGAPLRRRRGHSGDGRGGAALRPAAPPLHPLRARGRGGLRPPLPPAATPSAACSPPRTATRRASPTRAASIRPAPPGPQLAFGAGIHFCVGAPLARAELAIALPLLFARLPGLALASPPVFADRYHFRGLDRTPAPRAEGRCIIPVHENEFVD